MNRARRSSAAVAAVALVGAGFAGGRLTGPGGPGRGRAIEPGGGQAGEPATAPATGAAEAYGRLPMRFEPNTGQSDPGVQFTVRATDSTAFLTATGTVLTRPGSAPVRVRLVGAGPASAAGFDRQPGTSNYLLGADPTGWRTGVPGYAGVRQTGSLPGVDVVWHADRGRLKYDLVLAPGVDPTGVRVAFEGARDLRVDPSGDLVMATDGGELRQERPVAYQQDGLRRAPVPARYTIAAGGVGVALGAHDPARAVVIDPALTWSTALGGLGNDSASAVAVDATGAAYITGQTASSDFPTTGPMQATGGGGTDVVVAKLNPAGNALVYATYYGGGGIDIARGIAVDTAGAAYVTGETLSTNLPTAVPVQPVNGGGRDVFVAKLNPAGTALTYATYLGGTLDDIGRGIAVDTTGAAYVTGSAASTNFPTAGPAQAAAGGAGDAFVTKLNPAGTALAYSTYLGGSGADSGNGIAVGSTGSAYVAGSAVSTNFPVVAPFQATAGGAGDAFVARLNPAGSSLLASTYLGGAGADAANGIAVDAAGSAYVAGSTGSDNFPVVAAVQSTRAGEGDAFVTKLSPAGTALVYSTYLGGGSSDSAAGIAVSTGGNAVVAGDTGSADFPTADPVAAKSGNGDAFVAQLAASGSSLDHATFLGGNASDAAAAVAVDAAGAAYMAGSAIFFAAGDFPSVNAIQADPKSLSDAIVAKISLTAAGAPLVTGLAPASGPPAGSTRVVVTGSNFTGVTGVRFGADPAASFTVVSPTRIEAVSPAQGAKPAVVTVSVTTATGTSPANPVGAFRYGGEGEWTTTGAMTVARFVHTTTLLQNGKVLVTGGRSGQGAPSMATAEVYDPRAGTWAATGSMGIDRFAHTATRLADGRVLIAGGFTSGLVTNDQPNLDTAEIYDPATGRFSPTGSMATRRALHSAILLPNGKVLVAGGRTCTGPPPTACNSTFFTNTSELYDPVAGTWSPTGALSVSHHTTDMTFLGDGRVLLPAGFLDGVAGTIAEIYDPAAGSWSLTGALNVGRARAGATPLADGRIFVAGGFPNNDSAETYDPASGVWKLVNISTTFGRFNASFAALPSGRVLLAGGGNGGSSAEIYDPVADEFRSAGVMPVARGSSSSNSNSDKGVILSSSTDRLEADPGVCGANCGKLLIAGNTSDRRAQLYTPAPFGPGYWLAAEDGGIFAFGGARFFGSTGNIRLAQPVVGMASTPSGNGYWLVARDGGVFAFGDARFLGSTGALRLNQPILGMAATPSGRGYWLVASDGGVFAFGDARFLGSTGALRLNEPMVGLATTPSGNGYWLVARDGGIFAFGDARFLGSTGAVRLNQPVVAMAATPTGRGYWLVASDGGVFAFGNAAFLGSTGAIRLNRPMVTMAPSPTGGGYRLVAGDGGVFSFGDAGFAGSTGAIRLNQAIVATATQPVVTPAVVNPSPTSRLATRPSGRTTGAAGGGPDGG